MSLVSKWWQSEITLGRVEFFDSSQSSAAALAPIRPYWLLIIDRRRATIGGHWAS